MNHLPTIRTEWCSYIDVIVSAAAEDIKEICQNFENAWIQDCNSRLGWCRWVSSLRAAISVRRFNVVQLFFLKVKARSLSSLFRWVSVHASFIRPNAQLIKTIYSHLTKKGRPAIPRLFVEFNIFLSNEKTSVDSLTLRSRFRPLLLPMKHFLTLSLLLSLSPLINF